MFWKDFLHLVNIPATPEYQSGQLKCLSIAFFQIVNLANDNYANNKIFHELVR